MDNEPLFLADAMLGRLARWLRVLGLDTAFDPALSDAQLVAKANREGRWLLTRDAALLAELRPRLGRYVYSQKPLEQLEEVIRGFNLAKPKALFRRCLICNGLLAFATEEQVRQLAPPSAQALGGAFLYCRHCGRLYWPGSHTRRMEETLARQFPLWF
ncbi:Mut7-C RNAse domain-containing protein [Gallaecimonas kandeliae]|uniref:Mut7-C RNAse domain-containing protein n=1 Tax=Gallaecimonas kandeliae TaxID=3029055 RepID=UPI00264710EF|nr:Mut7-C RNAse domain-containing protein [Gallaecimonas kandeliae]WKE67007.1 Mut7-C RNAse domain-containing protein [Gallaecimonas kandeliae]